MDKTIIASFTLFLLFDQFQANHHQSRTTILLRNICPFELWPEIFNYDGTRGLQLKYSLKSGEESAVSVHNNWSGYVWARTSCSNHNGKFKCESGDCETGDINCYNNGGAHPFTMAYFYLDEISRRVIYNTDLAYGFNVPLKITPGDASCKISSCAANINEHCPEIFKSKTSNGKVVGCYNNRVVPDSAKFLKAQCPQAYVNQNDDMPTCTMDTSYSISFCPALE